MAEQGEEDRDFPDARGFPGTASEDAEFPVRLVSRVLSRKLVRDNDDSFSTLRLRLLVEKNTEEHTNTTPVGKQKQSK